MYSIFQLKIMKLNEVKTKLSHVNLSQYFRNRKSLEIKFFTEGEKSRYLYQPNTGVIKFPGILICSKDRLCDYKKWMGRESFISEPIIFYMCRNILSVI